MYLPWLLTSISCILFAAGIGGCATQLPVSSTQGTTLVQTAQITDIRDVTLGGDQSSGIGSVAGAVLGGLAGGKVGSGTGRTITSIGGAIAGGVAGHRIESAMATRTVTELTIRFENGDVRTYNVEPGAAFRIGETVKITTNRGVTKITH